MLFATALTFGHATAQTNDYGYPYTPVAFTSVKITPATLWGDRIKAARETTIPLAFSKCESEGRYANFVKAANPSDTYDVGKFMGFSFDDTDVYKTIEGASYLLQTYPDKRLETYIDSVLDIVGAAQEKDGYLYTARTINPAKPHPWAGQQRWVKEEDLSHELYNLGHRRSLRPLSEHGQSQVSRHRQALCRLRHPRGRPGRRTGMRRPRPSDSRDGAGTDVCPHGRQTLS